MPIEGIEQPRSIEIDNGLRLSAYEGQYDFAYGWYQDIDSLELIDGKGKAVPYTMERLEKMYTYLNAHGECYFIELKVVDHYVPVGDVTFWQEDMPIVISKEFQHHGIGKKVIHCLIQRAKELRYAKIWVQEIYEHNVVSRRLFESCGFIQEEATQDGAKFSLNIQ